MDEAHFDKTIRFKAQALEEDRTAVTENPGQFSKIEGVYERLFRFQHQMWMAQYSQGRAIEELRETFPLVVQAAEEWRRADARSVYAFNFSTTLDNYVSALWLLSQARLLKLGPATTTRLLASIGNEGQDLLLEQLASALVPGGTRKAAKKLLYPKVYQSLYDAINAPSEQQAALMQEFLKNWYKRMSNTGWHDAHKGPGGGGFFGYWCWEAAGVAQVFSLNDTDFRDLPYYPKDLAEFSRTAG